MQPVSIPQMNIIIDALYRNSLKSKLDQKSIKELTPILGVSRKVVDKVKFILKEMCLLIIEGERNHQFMYWNSQKSAPNPLMVTEVYRIYTKDAKSKIKVKIQKAKRRPNLDDAVIALVKLGFTGIIEKTIHSGHVTEIKRIDLSKVQVGD